MILLRGRFPVRGATYFGGCFLWSKDILAKGAKLTHPPVVRIHGQISPDLDVAKFDLDFSDERNGQDRSRAHKGMCFPDFELARMSCFAGEVLGSFLKFLVLPRMKGGFHWLAGQSVARAALRYV